MSSEKTTGSGKQSVYSSRAKQKAYFAFSPHAVAASTAGLNLWRDGARVLLFAFHHKRRQGVYSFGEGYPGRMHVRLGPSHKSSATKRAIILHLLWQKVFCFVVNVQLLSFVYIALCLKYIYTLLTA